MPVASIRYNTGKASHPLQQSGKTAGSFHSDFLLGVNDGQTGLELLLGQVDADGIL
jgi:glycerol-3-phosphate responsive antiterminator